MAKGEWPMADSQQLKATPALKSWIYSIARHKAMDALRKKYAQKRSAKIIPLHPEPAEDEPLPFEPADFMHPGVMLETQEQMQLFFSGINALPLQQKEALLLAKFEQMPVKDIAEMMGTTPKAVESLLQRAKQNFRSFLAERGINLNKTSGHGTT